MKICTIILIILFLLSVVDFEEVKAREKIENHKISKALTKNLLKYEKCFKANKILNKSIFSALLDDNFDVKFYLSTRKKPERVSLTNDDELDLKDLDFDVSRRTVFVIHGFNSWANSKWVRKLTQAYLKWGDINAIAVDWRDGAHVVKMYKKAAQNTQITGSEIAKFVSRVTDAAAKSKSPKSFGPIHMIGHSLGAHVSAFAASVIKKNNGPWQVQRITGLDPAQPCFSDAGSESRLDASDAPFVDVIHTNIETDDESGFGMSDQIGHIDIYPNGGAKQPGCKRRINVLKSMTCDHSRASWLFIDSIRRSVDSTCSIKAFRWDRNLHSLPSNIDMEKICSKQECIEFGINTEKYKDKFNGSFFSMTGSESPFCEVDDEAKAEVKSLVKVAKKSLKKESENFIEHSKKVS